MIVREPHVTFGLWLADGDEVIWSSAEAEIGRVRVARSAEREIRIDAPGVVRRVLTAGDYQVILWPRERGAAPSVLEMSYERGGGPVIVDASPPGVAATVSVLLN